MSNLVNGKGGGIEDAELFRTALDLSGYLTTADAADFVNTPWSHSDCVAAWHSDHTTISAGKITAWEDLTGNGKTLTQDNSSLQATWTKTGADIAAAGSYVITGGLALADYRAFTVIWIGRPVAASEVGMGGILFRVSGGPGVNMGIPYSFYYAPDGYGPPMSLQHGRNSYYAMSSAADENVVGIDGSFVSRAAFNAGSGSISYMFGDSGGGSGMRARTQAVLVFDRALSQAEISEVANWFGCPSVLGDKYIQFRGDSMTNGQGATTLAKTWHQIATEKLGWRFMSKGLNGVTMATINSGESTSTIKAVPYRQNIHIVFAGTNDLANATGAEAGLRTNVQAYCEKIRAADWSAKIVVCTIIARNSTWSGGQSAGGFEADRLSFNAWLVSNHTTFADALIDFAASPLFDAQSDADNATYYGDKIHPTDAGYLEMGKIAHAVIKSL